MVLTILGIIFLTSLITFVLVKNSNPNSRYKVYDYEDDEEDEEEEDDLTEDIKTTLEAMGFRKREIDRALYACPPNPQLPAEDNIKDILQYIGKHWMRPRQ